MSFTTHFFVDDLPDSFFEIPAGICATQSLPPVENPAAVLELFRSEAARNDIVVITHPAGLRVVGIFPHDGPDAYFGFWETIDDLALNQEAFARLADEARQLGYARLLGPLNFNTFHAYRLRVGPAPSWSVFDREPRNPPYYPVLLEQLGLAPVLTFESRLIRADAVPEAYGRKADLLAAFQQVPYDLIPLNPATWSQYEAELHALVDRVFGANPAYRQIPPAQFRRLYNAGFAAGLCPHTSVLFRDRPTGQLVAFSFCQPNYAPLGLGATPPNFARDYPRLKHKVLLAKTVGVHPDFRQQQLMSFLGAYGMLSFREFYTEIIFCLMRSDNFSRHFTDGLPMEVAHYALFGQELAG
jgi:hypothetical protein